MAVIRYYMKMCKSISTSLYIGTDTLIRAIKWNKNNFEKKTNLQVGALIALKVMIKFASLKSTTWSLRTDGLACHGTYDMLQLHQTHLPIFVPPIYFTLAARQSSQCSTLQLAQEFFCDHCPSRYKHQASTYSCHAFLYECSLFDLTGEGSYKLVKQSEIDMQKYLTTLCFLSVFSSLQKPTA